MLPRICQLTDVLIAPAAYLEDIPQGTGLGFWSKVNKNENV